MLVVYRRAVAYSVSSHLTSSREFACTLHCMSVAPAFIINAWELQWIMKTWNGSLSGQRLHVGVLILDGARNG